MNTPPASNKRETKRESSWLNDERLCLDAIGYISDINLRLQTCYLRIVREEKR